MTKDLRSNSCLFHNVDPGSPSSSHTCKCLEEVGSLRWCTELLHKDCEGHPSIVLHWSLKRNHFLEMIVIQGLMKIFKIRQTNWLLLPLRIIDSFTELFCFQRETYRDRWIRFHWVDSQDHRNNWRIPECCDKSASILHYQPNTRLHLKSNSCVHIVFMEKLLR